MHFSAEQSHSKLHSHKGTLYPWQSPCDLRSPFWQKDVNPLVKHRHIEREKKGTKRPGPICHLISNLGEKLYAWHLLCAKNISTSSELNKRGKIRISVCRRVHTGWLSPHVKGLSIWGQYVEFTLSLGVPQKECVRKAAEEVFKHAETGSRDVL